MTSVAIVVPTLLGGPSLDRCLAAVERQTYRDFEVIVVNNGRDNGADSSTGVARVIQMPGNPGFGAAINAAIRSSKAPLIATLNDDTEPDPGWLEALVAEMQSDPRVGMCASQIRQSQSECLDSAAMLICLDGSSKQRGGAMPLDSWPESGDALLPSACAALYRRSMLDQIGLFDEDFFLYCEDTDLGLRAQWAAWRCRYVAGALTYHDYSMTAGPFSRLKAHLVERNRIWLAIKNFPPRLLVTLPFVSLVRYLSHLRSIRESSGAAAGFIRSGHSGWSIAAILLRAHWETLIELPRLLKKRNMVRATRRIDAAEFIHILNRYRITAREIGRA
ncbi:MAG TPA: glycosyltransferase [Bryobacteraceae bacterium]|nr:glycosyltransferase [Bryobacteraceae bacterium]